MLIANRLIAPASEHGLAGWLETDFVCDRKGRRFIPHWHQRRRVRIHPRQLDAWYRTLDQLHAAKDQIEVALYHRLRDLFSLKPDLVLYDITSTYYPGNQDPHKSLQPIRSSNSRSRLPRDQRSTTESTEIHGKENPNQLPLSVPFPGATPARRVGSFRGYSFVMILAHVTNLVVGPS